MTPSTSNIPTVAGGVHNGDEANAEDSECQRLLNLLRRITNFDRLAIENTATNHHSLLTEQDAASLLSYLAKLRRFCDNVDANGGSMDGAMEWNETNVELIRLTVKAAMQSFNSSSFSSGTMIMDCKTARRLLTDGVLPFAATAVSMTASSTSPISSSETSLFHQGKPLTDISSSTATKMLPCIWIAKLIKSIVIEDLLPIALMSVQPDNGKRNGKTSKDSSGHDGTYFIGNRNNSDNNMTALEILLSTFLTRMDTDESSQIMAPETPTSSSTDAVLDRLCGLTMDGTSNKTSSHCRIERLRPSAATSIIAALREFESSNASPSLGGGSGSGTGLGRLSRRRVWKQQQTRGDTQPHVSVLQQWDFHYTFVDRPTSLLCAGLSCLHSLATTVDDDLDESGCGNNGGCDFDTLPPLVYQLALLPVSLTSTSTSVLDRSESGKMGSGDGDKVLFSPQENDKQRGVRLRRMCLEGIAFILEDDIYSSNRQHPTSYREILPNTDDYGQVVVKTKSRYKEAYRWARYTSLSHLGNCFRSDPGLSKAMLSLLSGEILVGATTRRMDHDNIDWCQSHVQRPFRYARLTPFTLAMGLSMATSVPRIRATTLGAICDLVLEEEMLRTRRGFAAVDPFEEDASSGRHSAVKGSSNISRRQPWMDCLVRCLEMDCTMKNDHDNSKDDAGVYKGINHVLHCLLLVAKFAENEHGGSSFSIGGCGCASSLLQSLHQLGFLLIDCVKKDEPIKTQTLTDKLNAMQSVAVLAPNLDISSFSSNNVTHVNGITSTSAQHAVAAVGRFLLSFLFYQSSSSSLSSSSLCMSSSQSGLGDTALCRSVLRSSFEKCCGNAPNALEHALLVKDLLRFRPSSVRQYLDQDFGTDKDNNDDLGWSMSDENDQQTMIALTLTSSYLPSIIDTLSNIPSGGMSPRVASLAIVPALGCLFLLMAAPSQRGLVGSLWKRHDLEDNVNQTFLLAKKCLYAPDVEKRKCAANMLVMLLGVTSVAASVSVSRNASSRGNKSKSVWNPILQDIKACLHRSLTQHQEVVRMEVYSSLVALLPSSAPNSNADDNKDLSATQDNTSPVSSSAPGTRGSRTPPPNVSSFKNIFDTIPPADQHATISIVSELLLSSLERYVTIPKEERIDREARRARAALGVGLSQIEMIVEEESDSARDKASGAEDGSNPFRFEKCISTRSSRTLEGNDTKQKEGKEKKRKSKVPLGQALLIEAIERINEPLPYLIASCIAVTSLATGETNDFFHGDPSDNELSNVSTSSSEMIKSINQLRQQFARCTDIQQYLQWIKTNKIVFDIKDNIKRAKEMAISKLATLMLVSAAADALISSCDLKDEKGLTKNAVFAMEVRTDSRSVANDVEDLFVLRSEAIEEAATIMSSFVPKPTRSVSASKSNGKKKKALKDMNPNSSSQPSERLTAETKSGKSVEFAKLRPSDTSQVAIAKNRKSIENILGNTCPATNHDFLAESLRKFGSEMSKKVSDDANSDQDEDPGNDNDRSANERLSRCLSFRRFIITKSLLLMSGSSSLVKAGSTFAPISLASSGAIHIASSLLLGPLLFVEFCTHCYDLDQTSIESSKSSSSSNLSLAQLSLRAFTSCVRCMSIDTGYHTLSRAARVNALLTSAIRKVSIAIPSSVDGWEHYKKSESSYTHCIEGAPTDDVALSKTLLPILSLATPSSSGLSSQNEKHICLLSELFSNCMYGETMECCYLISSAAEAFEEANCMEHQGVFLLRAFELGQHDVHKIGVLGIDHSDVSNEQNPCISAAISVAMKLNCGLDGNTAVPLPLQPDVSQDRLREARSKMGLSMTEVGFWPEQHKDRLEEEASKDNGMIGIATQIAWAILAVHGSEKHFSTTFDKNDPTKRESKLAVISAVSQTSESNFMKENASIANTISSAIEDALDNAEFVTLKLIPHMIRSSDLAQRFVSELIFSCSKMISLSAPSSLHIDERFASTLLKSTKRLYSVLTKLVLSFVNSPQALAASETKHLLDYLVGTLMRKVSALLLSLQEKQKTAGGRFLAERKIESHGKIAALLVFEKEKLDNSFLKVGAKLKQSGLKRESKWLENHIVANLNPDFSIKQVAEAREREAPAPKKKATAGSKRKAVQSSSKKKRAVIQEESGNDDDDDDSVVESVDADDVMDDDEDVISLSNLTADIYGEQNSDDDSEEIDDQSESGSEAEFN